MPFAWRMGEETATEQTALRNLKDLMAEPRHSMGEPRRTPPERNHTKRASYRRMDAFI